MNRLPVAMHFGHRPPVTMKLNVFDTPDIRARIDKNPPAQHTTINTADAVTHVALWPDADAVIGINEGDILDGVIVALQVKRPGIRADVSGLLFRIPHRHAAHG